MEKIIKKIIDNSYLISGIEDKALELGFDEVGFCQADISSITSKNLIKFIDKGRHGEMKWMSDNLHRRLKPVNMWKDAKSAVVVLANYSNNQNPFHYFIL